MQTKNTTERGMFNMSSMDSVIFLHNLECDLSKKMLEFEDEVRNRWYRLSNFEANSLYYGCPYFDDIDTFFETALMRIADSACRQYKAFSGQSMELSWYSIRNDYPDIIEEMCKPYSDAFEAVSSQARDRLRETRARLENTSSGRIHGYITNSFGTALAYEALQGISSALKEIENDRNTWQSATALQLTIHNKLSDLWRNNFNSVFMKKIISENKSVVSAIIMRFCSSFGYTYENYLATKETQEFISALQDYKNAQKELKESQDTIKERQKKENLDYLNNEMKRINEELAELSLALWGEKKERKKALLRKQEALNSEIRAVRFPIPLQSTFTAYISYSSPLYRIFMKNLWPWMDRKDYWRFEYSEKDNDYVAYTPENEAMFKLGQGFTQKYGRFRKIGAKFEGCPLDSEQRRIAEMLYSIFEIEE